MWCRQQGVDFRPREVAGIDQAHIPQRFECGIIMLKPVGLTDDWLMPRQAKPFQIALDLGDKFGLHLVWSMSSIRSTNLPLLAIAATCAEKRGQDAVRLLGWEQILFWLMLSRVVLLGQM